MDAHQEAKRRIAETFIAALIVRPLDPSLTQEEVETIVVESGINRPVFREVIYKDWEERDPKFVERACPLQADLTRLASAGDYGYPNDLFPMSVIRILNLAFDSLDREHGSQALKTLEMLASRCAPQSIERVELALGFLVIHRRVTKNASGYVRTSTVPDRWKESQLRPHPWVQPVKNLVPSVERVFAARQGQSTPSTPPVERFYRFLNKQGWSELAAWWAMTSREMRELGNDFPTAKTVVAGALLEAALVAIAEPAKNAGEWRQDFLSGDPRGWRLQDLIKQAEAAKTFNASEAGQAQIMAERRNRIHAGRYSTGGKGPFNPPSTNAHEADIAKLHLDLLLNAILMWPPISKLT